MKVSGGTIIRTTVLIIALLNQVLTALGKSPLPFSSEQTEQGVSAAITVCAAIVTWWKNNSFSAAAIEADEYMRIVRESAEIE